MLVALISLGLVACGGGGCGVADSIVTASHKAMTAALTNSTPPASLSKGDGLAVKVKNLGVLGGADWTAHYSSGPWSMLPRRPIAASWWRWRKTAGYTPLSLGPAQLPALSTVKDDLTAS